MYKRSLAIVNKTVVTILPAVNKLFSLFIKSPNFTGYTQNTTPRRDKLIHLPT